jgi:hypothetical protein
VHHAMWVMSTETRCSRRVSKPEECHHAIVERLPLRSMGRLLL